MEHAFTAFGKLDTAAEPKKLRVGTILGTVKNCDSGDALQVVVRKGGLAPLVPAKTHDLQGFEVTAVPEVTAIPALVSFLCHFFLAGLRSRPAQLRLVE